MTFEPKPVKRKHKEGDRPLEFNAELPLPVSVNDLHTLRQSGSGVCLTQAARSYYWRMSELMPKLWPWAPFATERLRLEYSLHETDHRRRDVSNYVKSLQDGMEGFLYVNDSQIDEVLAVRGEMTETPFVRVRVLVIESPAERVKVKRAPADVRAQAVADEVEKLVGRSRVGDFFLNRK